MNVTVGCGDLKVGLQHVINVIPSKTTLPILNHILFEAGSGQLTLSATDLEVSLKTKVNAQIEKEGNVTIPGRLLYDVVREIPDVPLSIKSDENNRINLKYSRGQYTFFGEDSREFPQRPAIDVKHEIEVEKKRFSRHIEKTIFAVSNDELRAALMGVLLQVRENEYRMISTDGHRLVRVINKSFETEEKINDIIIPVKALNLLQKNLNSSGNVKISFGSNHVIFDLEEASISVSLIEGKYPEYEKVIPVNEEKILNTNREQMITALRTVSVVANKITQQVKISIDKDKITVKSEDMDRGEGIETIEAEYTGEPLDIGFNSAYVLDVLRHIDTENVQLKFDSAVSASLVFPMEQEKDEDVLMLVMPIKLRESVAAVGEKTDMGDQKDS
jgi:DNA polymerase-3 subunit beta